MLVALLVAVAVGSPATTPVTGMDGVLHQPLLEARGKPIAFVFISHDCPICNAYAPELKRIASAYARRGVKLDLVYAESNFSRSQAIAHGKAYGYSKLARYLDSKGAFAKACGATITPEAAVYDADGRRVYLGRIDNRYFALGQQRARVTTHDLRAALDAVLARRPPPHPTTTAVGCYIEAGS